MANTQKHINYSYTDIEKYLHGKMNASEMHAFEKAALSDSFLAEAVDGYREINATEAANRLQQIETAILSNQEKTKVVSMPTATKKHYWRVAASVIVLIGIGGITFQLLNKKSTENSIAKTEINKPQINNNNQATVTPPTVTNKEEEKNAVAQNTSPKNIQTKKEPVIASAENANTAPSALKDDKLAEKKETAAILKADSLQPTTASKENVSAPQTLSETVVTSIMKNANAKSYSSQKRYELMPEDGWDNYKNYLRKILSENFKTDEFKGTIELAILINNSGKVEDVNVNKSPNQKINNTIIKAIKEGGNWLDSSPSKDKKEKKIVIFTLQ
ncbi:MAG: hypothetical protein JST94_02100 [Bacteroidetes bacterium]|nr:hypothetical protein [Bacteroidota bacterium]MBS1670238.1 hypothetical protein [Bacteroidota bacterium]